MESEAPTPVHRSVRRGETVARYAGAWSEPVQGFLKHLRDRGLAIAPAPMGFDSRGNELVSWVDGEAGREPLQPELQTDAVLVKLGQLVRQLHDASAGFDLTQGGWQDL